MRIEWAVLCSGAETTDAGAVNLTDMGMSSLDCFGHGLPTRAEIPVVICFRAQPGDEQGIRYDYEIEVVGPDGAQPAMSLAVDHHGDTSPKLVDPERSYVIEQVVFTVTRSGEYRVRLSDASGERYVVPSRVSVFPV